MMKNYEAKVIYLSIKQKGNCAIAAAAGSMAQITELHHRLHNTKVNREKYPLFIDSVFNLVAVNYNYHALKPHFQKINYIKAAKIEAMLVQHPELAAMGNDPSGLSEIALAQYRDSL